MAKTDSSKEILDFIKKTKPAFKKWETHIKESDWSKKIERLYTEPGKEYYNEDGEKSYNPIPLWEVEFKNKKFDYKVQVGLVSKILGRLDWFLKKSQQDYRDPAFRRFFKYACSIVKIHLDRCDKYTVDVDIMNIKIEELQNKEVEFHGEVFNDFSKKHDILTSYGYVDKDEDTSNIVELYGGAKASIAVCSLIFREYPHIKARVDEMGIDFTSPPPPTIHILNENPPKWDKDKHFWEQKKETLQYYVDERKKIRDGVTIDGYFFDGWLYFHFNHFVTPIPNIKVVNGVEVSEDIMTNPPLRDNEVLIGEYFQEARKNQLWALIAASRRVAKTTMNASRVEYAKIAEKLQIVIAGGSSTDLGHINRNCDTHQINCNPAFAITELGENSRDSRGVDWGIRRSNNRRITLATVFFLNLEAGGKVTKKEILAGFTPDEFIVDEAFKFHFLEILNPIKPALKGAGVARATPIMTATGGDDELAADGIKVLDKPSSYDIQEMNWDSLEKGVDKEYITWTRKSFGLFLPGQMSIFYRGKDKIPFSQYIGKDPELCPTLSKLELSVTNWKDSKDKIEQEREKVKDDKVELTKLKAYHPLDPEDIFLSGKVNPFPADVAKAHRKYLVETGKWDARRDLYRDSTGKIVSEISTKELLPYPFTGVSDAPFLIFEAPPPKEKIVYGMYTAGFDDYKQDDSDNDSVATFYVWKNEMLGHEYSKRIVASISTHPEKHRNVWEKWLLLMEYYNLRETCFGENEDMGIKDFLDIRKKTETYLATNVDFTASLNLPNNNKRRFGWTPRTTKQKLLTLFIEYCNEDIPWVNEEGEEITIKGVQLIDDIILLDEIIKYKEGANVDRIIGAIGGYGYLHYLLSSYAWTNTNGIKERIEEKQEKNKTFKKSFYANDLRGFYGRKRIGRQ